VRSPEWNGRFRRPRFRHRDPLRHAHHRAGAKPSRARDTVARARCRRRPVDRCRSHASGVRCARRPDPSVAHALRRSAHVAARSGLASSRPPPPAPPLRLLPPRQWARRHVWRYVPAPVLPRRCALATRTHALIAETLRQSAAPPEGGRLSAPRARRRPEPSATPGDQRSPRRFREPARASSSPPDSRPTRRGSSRSRPPSPRWFRDRARPMPRGLLAGTRRSPAEAPHDPGGCSPASTRHGRRGAAVLRARPAGG
jgi:hypothetical protein